jgi:hypothetical protein
MPCASYSTLTGAESPGIVWGGKIPGVTWSVTLWLALSTVAVSVAVKGPEPGLVVGAEYVVS